MLTRRHRILGFNTQKSLRTNPLHPRQQHFLSNLKIILLQKHEMPIPVNPFRLQWHKLYVTARLLQILRRAMIEDSMPAALADDLEVRYFGDVRQISGRLFLEDTG